MTNFERIKQIEDKYDLAMVMLNIGEYSCELCPRHHTKGEDRCNEDCNNGICEWLFKEYNPEEPAWEEN